MPKSLYRCLFWISLMVLMVVFIFLNAAFDTDYIIPGRISRLAAIVLGGICVAVSAILFQTLSGNRILTPSIMGYEAVYILFQSLSVLLLGINNSLTIGVNLQFVLSFVVVVMYSVVLHYWLIRRRTKDVFLLLLTGLVISMVLMSFNEVIQFSISPGEFALLQSYTQTSFNRATIEQLAVAGVTISAVCVLVLRKLDHFDLLYLGRDQASSLGLDYPRFSAWSFVLIALLVAASTSLIGPTAFFGIFVANVAYRLSNSFRHRLTLPYGCGVAIFCFLLAQLLVEHVFNYKASAGLLVNLCCGAYFLMIIVRPRSFV